MSSRIQWALSMGMVATIAACSSASAPPEALGQTGQAVDMICGEAPGATLDGFPAYAYCGNFNVYTSNGIDTRSTGGSGWTQTEGGYGYQCVEWAVRYFYFKWNVSRSWFVGYAKDMCASHPSDVSVTSSPVHGDLAIFTPGCAGADATAGHVAAIDTVQASTIGVVQENPAGRMTWPRSCVSCYLHAASNGGASDPCSTAPASGLYCGQSTQWGGGTPNDLYDCENGSTASKTPCPYGCHAAPYGTNDSCNPAPPDAGSSADASLTADAAAPSDGAPATLPFDGGPANAADGGAPPTANDAGSFEAPPGAGSQSSAGCSTAPGGATEGGSNAAWVVLVAMGLVGARRRRRS